MHPELKEWYDSKPKVIQEMFWEIPFGIYKFKDSQKKGRLYSYSEDGTVTLDITKDVNPDGLLLGERRVFGIEKESIELVEAFSITEKSEMDRLDKAIADIDYFAGKAANTTNKASLAKLGDRMARLINPGDHLKIRYFDSDEFEQAIGFNRRTILTNKFITYHKGKELHSTSKLELPECMHKYRLATTKENKDFNEMHQFGKK